MALGITSLSNPVKFDSGITVGFYKDVSQWKETETTCKILNIKLEGNFIIGGVFWSTTISMPAIIIGYLLGFRFSTKDEIKVVLQSENKQKIIEMWNIIVHNQDEPIAFIMNLADKTDLENCSKQGTVDAASSSSSSSKTETAENKSTEIQLGSESFKKGEIAIQGTQRQLVFNEDSISLEAIVRSGGLGGLIDDSVRIQNENIFLEDIRGITVYQGKSVSNMVLTTMFGGNANEAALESLSYIRFEIKGVNDIRTHNPSEHPYTVTIRSEQINEAQKLKTFLEKKIREIKAAGRTPVQAQPSSADELLKYSELLEKGLITKEDFNNLKKKLLGL